MFGRGARTDWHGLFFFGKEILLKPAKFIEKLVEISGSYGYTNRDANYTKRKELGLCIV